MFTAFQTALSALTATSTAIDVTGNNLANLNTTGFKASTVSFSDLVTQSYGSTASTQAGAGLGAPQSSRTFTQGAMQNTSAPLDAAIQGGGFFVLKGANNSQQLTRDGSFQTDPNGYLTTGSGQKVQGWTQLNVDGTVNTNAAIGDIKLPAGTLQAPVASTQFGLTMNLDSTATAAAAVPPATSPTLSSNATFSHTVSVIDSLGNSQTVNITFTKSAGAQNSWNFAVSANPSALATPPAATVPDLSDGTITFNTDGTFKSVTTTTGGAAANGQIPITFPTLANGAAAPLTVNWNLNDASGKSTITQVAEASGVSANAVDGTAPSELQSVSIGNGGVLTALFSNGQTKTVGTLALASVGNPASLIDVGDNNYQITAQTAVPVVGVAQTGGRGQILGGSLESSTADIAKEFTNLIVYQRGYQANAKVINTEDQLTQDTISLKQ